MSGIKHIPALPDSAPFTPRQRAWINGFLAGIFNEAQGSAAARPVSKQDGPSAPVHIFFGSQSGSSEQLAKRIAKEAAARGFLAVAKPLNELPGVKQPAPLVVVTSTWGDGDPPDNALQGWQWLNSETPPVLTAWPFAVLALGDRNYSEFCGAGKKFDARLEALGGKRMIPRADCDVDYESTANTWIESLWPALETARECPPEAAPAGVTPATAEPVAASGKTGPLGSRMNPLRCLLKAQRRLNAPSSSKDTRHIEIVLTDSAVAYETGDALGVVPSNCPVLVEELLATLGFKGEETVKSADGASMVLHEALLTALVITQPGSSLLKASAERSSNAELLDLLKPDRKAALDAWLHGRDIVDVLKACPGASFQPDEFVALLRKLQPRLYSISSSPKAHPGEVHLTVATVRYESHGRPKKGVASCWLADRVPPGETPVQVFVQTSKHFRLPAEGATPIIMVGPGTGIAPFRAFLEERRATGAQGGNWLFFGDQRRDHDFLYEEQMRAFKDDGHLSRLDLAFSRDQAEKIYVQHRMLEHASELWRWLEDGAHFYVCGDARKMAKDVDAALHEVIAKAGGKSEDQAASYVAALKTAHRYQRDVY